MINAEGVCANSDRENIQILRLDMRFSNLVEHVYGSDNRIVFVSTDSNGRELFTYDLSLDYMETHTIDEIFNRLALFAIKALEIKRLEVQNSIENRVVDDILDEMREETRLIRAEIEAVRLETALNHMRECNRNLANKNAAINKNYKTQSMITKKCLESIYLADS